MDKKTIIIVGSQGGKMDVPKETRCFTEAEKEYFILEDLNGTLARMQSG